VTDRKWSSYGSDGEPADDDDDDDETGGVVGDELAATNDASTDSFNDSGTRVASTTHATSSASFVTSFVTSESSSLTSGGGDVRRPRTTADGCEDEVGAGALDLIRHALLPAARSPDLPLLQHSASWKALDDVAETGAELDSYVDPRPLSAGGGKLFQTSGPQTASVPPW